MVLTHETSQSSERPMIRPMNLPRDMPQVIRLLNVVFSPTLDADGRRALNSLSNKPYVITRLNQMAGGLAPGYVWEEAGTIVGNVSLMPTKTPGRIIVANVAVDPAYRRRGIARRLMETAVAHARTHMVRSLVLQVDGDNGVARGLYERLGFASLGTTTRWLASFSSVRELAVADEFEIRPIRRAEYAVAYHIDTLSQPVDLHWPEPVSPRIYRSGLLRWWDDFLNGRQSETWTVPDEHDRPLAIASIWSEWGRAHDLTVRVPAEWHDLLTRPLLAKLLRRLSYLRRRSVQIEHVADDELMTALLHEANFRPKRSLTTMRLDLA